MKFKLTNKQVEVLRPQLEDVEIHWGFAKNDHADGERDITIPTTSLKNLTKIREVFLEAGIRSQILARHISLLKDPANTKVSNLDSLPQAFTKFFKDAVAKDPNAIYLVKESDAGVAYAYLPTEVNYEEPSHRSEQPSVKLELEFEADGEADSVTIRLSKRDLGTSISQMLTSRGYRLMDAEYKVAYQQDLEKFRKLEKHHAHQVWVRGDCNRVTARNSWWDSDTRNLAPAGRPTRGVIDWDATPQASKKVANTTLTGERVIPVHPNVPVFSLAFHETFWVHVSNIASYKYDANIQDKLVLPESHQKLVSALVSNMTQMQTSVSDDSTRIIQDKAKSNVILSMGPPGTGKTLTAEVYAEAIRRPLYDVAAGQLGLDETTIAERLDEVLTRSLRLNMPLVLNEADVFVRARNDDIQQNAVCATFLLKLEYHTGIVFLTTNREVDHAIRSRCIAEIRYAIPEQPQRKRLWEILSKEFNVRLTEAELKEASIVFPSVVGRDIQNLLRLTTNVCAAHEQPVTLQALKENAIFKSIEVVDVVHPPKRNNNA